MNILHVSRRWLQFRLRSLLLGTLVVAAWLGYEVRQVRTVERQSAAIEALGGHVECELCGWSLLRHIMRGNYGEQIVQVAIPGQSAESAVETLVAMPRLREVLVRYDGSCDLFPGWDQLNAALSGSGVRIIAHSWSWGHIGLLDRPEAKMAKGLPKVQEVLHRLASASMSSEPWAAKSRQVDHHLVRLPDDALAEVFLGGTIGLSATYDDTELAVLIVNDQAVDAVLFRNMGRPMAQLVDVDGDGFCELGFQCRRTDERAQRMPGDARSWFGLYKIEHNGFRSILPQRPPESLGPSAEGPRQGP